MRNKIRIFVIVVSVVVLGEFAWLVLSQPPEPVYKNKPLSFWLEGYDPEQRNAALMPAEANRVVRHIGTNGVPTLLRMLRAKDSRLMQRAVRLARRQTFMNLHLNSAWQQNYEAARGFGALGADASNAVPALIAIFDQALSPESQTLTADALGYIGPNASGAVLSLLQGANDTNKFVRYYSILALRRINAQPAIVVPALMKALKDPDLSVRSGAVEALGAFGANAKLSIPSLIGFLEDGNADLRTCATNALLKIDPEAASKAGVKMNTKRENMLGRP